MTPERLRAYVLIVTRDLLPPVAGTFLTWYLPTHDLFEYWQLPLLAGLYGIPLVAPRPEAPPEPPQVPGPSEPQPSGLPGQ